MGFVASCTCAVRMADETAREWICAMCASAVFGLGNCATVTSELQQQLSTGLESMPMILVNIREHNPRRCNTSTAVHAYMPLQE